MLHVYQAICGLVVFLVIEAVFRARRAGEQVTGGILLVVLLLRLFLVK